MRVYKCHGWNRSLAKIGVVAMFRNGTQNKFRLDRTSRVPSSVLRGISDLILFRNKNNLSKYDLSAPAVGAEWSKALSQIQVDRMP